MNKAIRYILISFIIGSFFFSALNVNANSISKIEMDVYIDRNGNAIVKEVWNAYLSEGTEGYRTYTDLGNSYISDFHVSDDSGKEYESIAVWDTNESFANKAYKNGINEIYDGVELCWGISNYGGRTYTLNYRINNFVTQYTDKQGIYFNFLDMDNTVNNVKITIHSDVTFSLDTAKIWAFGYGGSIIFENGSIVLDSSQLFSNQYMVALIRFESNYFTTTNKSNKSFDDIYDSAFSDVNKIPVEEPQINNSRDTDEGNEFLVSLCMILMFIFLTPFGWIIISNIKKSKQTVASIRKYGNLDYSKAGKTLPSENEINYWREIPCDKDLERAYWVCAKFGVVPESTLIPGYIGAVLLKWIKKGYITVVKTPKRLFSNKDDNYAVNFSKMAHIDNDIEWLLYDVLISASGSNKILEAKEFSKWSQKNYQKINTLFEDICNKEQDALETQGLIINEKKEKKGLFGKIITVDNRVVSPKLKDDATQLLGLKKFLLDFSRVSEREYFEVHILEEYLIFAELLGIADKVEEQFSKLYPKFKVESFDSDITTLVIREISDSCYSGMQIGITRAAESSSFDHDYSGSSIDSGSGGSSYDSGGSSAGGSSGGGFR